tara:strand:+ start:206 stop:598 length:393 start_codon:yes stop_codon:yes gene_type:complete
MNSRFADSAKSGSFIAVASFEAPYSQNAHIDDEGGDDDNDRCVSSFSVSRVVFRGDEEEEEEEEEENQDAKNVPDATRSRARRAARLAASSIVPIVLLLQNLLRVFFFFLHKCIFLHAAFPLSSSESVFA